MFVTSFCFSGRANLISEIGPKQRQNLAPKVVSQGRHLLLTPIRDRSKEWHQHHLPQFSRRAALPEKGKKKWSHKNIKVIPATPPFDDSHLLRQSSGSSGKKKGKGAKTPNRRNPPDFADNTYGWEGQRKEIRLLHSYCAYQLQQVPEANELG